MSQERTGVITFKGGPMTLVGPEVKAGDRAPEFNLTAGDMSAVTLGDSSGKVRVISVVPSIDTPVCDQQTRRFNEEAASLSDDIQILTVSLDLPFAQKRFCEGAGIEKVQLLSDYKNRSFADAYGVTIKELGLLTRAVFVVDREGAVRHAEYVSEVTEHPNYGVAIEAAKNCL